MLLTCSEFDALLLVTNMCWVDEIEEGIIEHFLQCAEEHVDLGVVTDPCQRHELVHIMIQIWVPNDGDSPPDLQKWNDFCSKHMLLMQEYTDHMETDCRHSESAASMMEDEGGNLEQLIKSATERCTTLHSNAKKDWN